jgi:hypothetical protein
MDQGSGENALSRAMFSVYASRFYVLTLFECIGTICQIVQPFIIIYLIKFIKHEEGVDSWEFKDGLYLAGALCITEALAMFIH